MREFDVMRAISPFTALLATIAFGPTSTSAADPVHPTVIELFQSQGCSSCPPANANVMALAGRPDILALSFQVTYWDQLGWKDTFAQAAFTSRQWDYAHALRHPNVFTPQVVVNGRRDGVGADPGELRALVAAGDRGASGPALRLTSSSVIVGTAPHGSGDVWLVRFDPRIVQVHIGRGENAGRTLPHRNVVRSLVRLGRWAGSRQSFNLPPTRDPALKDAVLVQAGTGGAILAAVRD